jgi:hypothetical protein
MEVMVTLTAPMEAEARLVAAVVVETLITR